MHAERSTQCDRSAVREYCAAQKAYHHEQWKARHSLWVSFTTSTLKALDDFYYRVSDATYHWVDRTRYAQAHAWAESRLWSARSGAAGELIAYVQGVPVDILVANEDPYWCDTPVERAALPEGEEPKLEKVTSLQEWCPDSASKGFDVGFASFTMGCKEIAMRVQDGPVFGECSYNIKDQEFTAYAGVGGKLAGGKLEAEAGVFVTVSKGGAVDVGGKASAKAFDTFSAEGQISGKGYSSEVKVFNEQVWEKKGSFPMPDANTPYVTPAPP